MYTDHVKPIGGLLQPRVCKVTNICFAVIVISLCYVICTVDIVLISTHTTLMANKIQFCRAHLSGLKMGCYMRLKLYTVYISLLRNSL